MAPICILPGFYSVVKMEEIGSAMLHIIPGIAESGLSIRCAGDTHPDHIHSLQGRCLANSHDTKAAAAVPLGSALHTNKGKETNTLPR